MKIYLDVDDTLGAFRAHCVARGVPTWEGSWYTTDPKTWTDEQRAIQSETNRQMEMECFWREMPVADGAFEIIAAAAAQGEVHLLTALPTGVHPSYHPRILVDKKRWAFEKLHFPTERVIVCHRVDKRNYALGHAYRVNGRFDNVRNILVDDAEQNCAEWADAGGVAVHHNTVEDTVRALKKVREVR